MAERFFNLRTNPGNTGTDTRKMGLELIDDLNQMKLIHDELQASYTEDVTDRLINAEVIQKEPTGFTDPENIIVTYDATARTITLTGNVEGYYQGVPVAALVSGYVSPPHPATTGQVYFLSYDGSTISWATSPWMFYQLQIAVVVFNSAEKFGVRECHGLMTWQAHKEFHEALGTYRSFGGTMSGFTLSSTTAANRRPVVASAVINDEDLATTNASLAAGTYTQLYLAGSGATATFTTGAGDVVPLSAANPYYNLNTAGTWSQSLMTANSAMSIWLFAVPTTSDAGSQAYRYLWLQGQWQTLAAGAAAAQITAAVNAELQRNVSELSLGTFANLSPEYVCIGRIVIDYTGGNWTLRSVALVTGTRVAPVTTLSGNYLSAANAPLVPNDVACVDTSGNIISSTTLGSIRVFQDATNGILNVVKTGGASGNQIFNITGTPGNECRFTQLAYGNAATHFLNRANGTSASPTAILSGNDLCKISAGGYDGTATVADEASIIASASENWSSTAHGTRWLVYRTATGALTSELCLDIREFFNIYTGGIYRGGFSSGGFWAVTTGANVASATTITPTAPQFHVTGTTAIVTINAPYSGFNGQITIIPDGAFTWTAAGNIALAGTAVVSKALIMTYDNNTAKWYPSYT